jgi:hypothetical protein
VVRCAGLICSLLLVALAGVAPVRAQAEPGPPSAPETGARTGEDSVASAALDQRLASIALDEPDLPTNLRLYTRTPVASDEASGRQRHEVRFLAESLPSPPPAGAMVSAYNVVVVANSFAPTLDRLIRDLQQDWGSTAELPAPAVGEESRAAATVTRPEAAPPAVSTAGVAFRRGPVLIGVAVSAVGSAPPVAEAVRLAQLMDARAATVDR